MNSLERMLQALTDELLSAVREYEDQLATISPQALDGCKQQLLGLLETLCRARAKQSEAGAVTPWREFSPLEGATRILWVEGRPLKPSEIIPKLLARGWRIGSTRTPNGPLATTLRRPDPFAAMVVASDPLNAFRTSNGMSSLLKVGLMVLSVAGLSSCREPGRLATFAASAKQRGEKTAEIFDKVPRVTSNNLESALKESSVVLATALPKQIVVTTPETVGTWQFVKIEQWLSQVPSRPFDCGQFPRPPAVQSADEAVLGIGAGTTTIDGVEVSVTTEASIKFTPGQLYLLLVGECPNQEVRLIYGEQSVYLVDDTGAISAPRSETFDPFAKELLGVKTVDAIKERIRNSSR